MYVSECYWCKRCKSHCTHWIEGHQSPELKACQLKRAQLALLLQIAVMHLDGNLSLTEKTRKAMLDAIDDVTFEGIERL